MAQRGVSAKAGPPVEPLYIFLFGIFALIVGCVLAVVLPSPPLFARAVITTFIGMGGAALSSAFTGFIQVNAKWVKAGGPIGVFVFICLFIWKSAGG
jgi:hypothetical protein